MSVVLTEREQMGGLTSKIRIFEADSQAGMQERILTRQDHAMRKPVRTELTEQYDSFVPCVRHQSYTVNPRRICIAEPRTSEADLMMRRDERRPIGVSELTRDGHLCVG